MGESAQTEALARSETTKAQEMLAVAQAAVIETGDQYVDAGNFRKAIRKYERDVEDMEKSATRPILAGLETVRSWFRPARDASAKARAIMDQKLTAWNQQKERLRLAEEAKLREKARAEEAKLRDQAAKLEQKGKTVQAQAKLEAAESIPTPAVVDTTPKVKGMHFREDWDFEVINADDVPDQYWCLDLDKIRKLVRATKGELEIAGIRIFKKQTVASGS